MSFILGIVSLKADKAGADPALWGADETYIKIDGHKVWEHDFKTGQSFQVRHPAVTFQHDIQIELFDEDDGFWNSDDKMGSTIVTGNQNDPLNVAIFHDPVTLSGSGSKYTMAYYTMNIGDSGPGV